MGDRLHGIRMSPEKANPARIIVVAGMIMPAGQPLDGADEAVFGDQLHHAVEGEAEEVLGDAQDGATVSRRRHHLLRLNQQAAHARLHIDVDPLRKQRAADRMMRRNRTDDKSRFHRTRLDQLLQVIKRGHADLISEGISRFPQGITDGDDFYPRLEKIE